MENKFILNDLTLYVISHKLSLKSFLGYKNGYF